MSVFLTGCDVNTEWQLPWFIENYQKHCKLPLLFADFGMSEEALNLIAPVAENVVKTPRKGWFSKINALEHYAHMYDKVCWVDTDCQILRDPSAIFRYTEAGKLTMVKDHPWSTRRPELGDWYNSGVVAVEGPTPLLTTWKAEAAKGTYVGDQEALHGYIGGDIMRRVATVSEAPHRFNVLRIDLIDKTVPENPVIMHWTGQKGNDEIRRQMGQ